MKKIALSILLCAMGLITFGCGSTTPFNAKFVLIDRLEIQVVDCSEDSKQQTSGLLEFNQTTNGISGKIWVKGEKTLNNGIGTDYDALGKEVNRLMWLADQDFLNPGIQISECCTISSSPSSFKRKSVTIDHLKIRVVSDYSQIPRLPDSSLNNRGAMLFSRIFPHGITGMIWVIGNLTQDGIKLDRYATGHEVWHFLPFVDEDFVNPDKTL
jgi:hypothetical protein